METEKIGQDNHSHPPRPLLLRDADSALPDSGGRARRHERQPHHARAAGLA